MPRPCVLIRIDDLALAEAVRSDVSRAGGTPVQSGAVPLAIVAGRTLEALLERTREAGAAETIVIHTGTTGLNVPLALFERKIHHYIHESAVAHNIYPTVRKILSGDIFGLDKYLPAAQTRRLRIDSYSGRGLAIDAVMRAANSLGLPRLVREQMTQATEELLINALYQAPLDEQGDPVFADVSPRERLTMRSPLPVSLRYASSDQFFAVAVRDRYGSLHSRSVINKLSNAQSVDAPSEGRVLGSGRGLYRVAQRATSIAINVAPGSVSEVVCTFAREPRPHGALTFFKQRSEQGSEQGGGRGEGNRA